MKMIYLITFSIHIDYILFTLSLNIELTFILIQLPHFYQIVITKYFTQMKLQTKIGGNSKFSKFTMIVFQWFLIPCMWCYWKMYLPIREKVQLSPLYLVNYKIIGFTIRFSRSLWDIRSYIIQILLLYYLHCDHDH